jgi:cell division protein FtsL
MESFVLIFSLKLLGVISSSEKVNENAKLKIEELKRQDRIDEKVNG